MSIEAVQDAVVGEQAERRRRSRFFKQHRLSEYPARAKIAVDVYGMNGSSTWGYVIRQHRLSNGVQQVRCKNFGPETWRTHDWQDVEEIE